MRRRPGLGLDLHHGAERHRTGRSWESSPSAPHRAERAGSSGLGPAPPGSGGQRGGLAKTARAISGSRRDRSAYVGKDGSPRERLLRRRPPCRNFGGDARSRELAGRIVERAGRISALHREQLADIAEFDRSEGWRGDGAVSMIAWVTGQCGVSTSTARQWVRAGSNLESLPCLAEGLASGELSLDLVEPLAEVACPSNDAALRRASAHWSVRQARELVAWHRAQVESQADSRAAAAAGSEGSGGGGPAADGDEADGHEGVGEEGAGGPAAREFERRTLRFNDTRRSVWVAFTKEDYAVAKSALVGRVSAAEVAQGADAVGYTPYDQRLYDALMDLFWAGRGSGSGCGVGIGTVGSGVGVGIGIGRRPGGRVGPSGRPAPRRRPCAARAAHRLLE